MAEDVRLSELIERFEADPGGAGVDPSLIEALAAAAPPSTVLSGRLLGLAATADERGRFAVAALALALAADPGYRRVVETVVTDHPLGTTYRPWLVMRGARLDGEALRWWLDLVADRFPAEPIVYALHRRREIVLARDRDAVAAHLVRTDPGPARYAAELATEILCRGGPYPSVEAMFSRWIDRGRFDEDVPDTADGNTSARVLATSLERGIRTGPFTERWGLAQDAVEHWRELLASDVPERHRRGLACMSALLTVETSLAGLLPWGLADRRVRDRPEWPVIERGFSAVNAARRRPRQAADQREVVRQAARELAASADGVAPGVIVDRTRRWWLRGFGAGGHTGPRRSP